jgi:hypothetical protein
MVYLIILINPFSDPGGHSIAPWVLKKLAIGQRGDKMNKIVALLLTILFALSVMGCATTENKAKWYNDQSSYKINGQDGASLWYPGQGRGSGM